MKYEIIVESDYILVNLSKEIYVEDAANFREQLLPFLQKGHKRFIIDTSKLKYIDSSGLGVLIGIQKRAVSNNGEVIIRGLNGDVKELFELTRLTKVFGIES